MAFALKLGSSGHLEQVADAEAIQADALERKAGSGNLVVGSGLGGGEELQLGSTTALTRSMGDAQVDGQVLITDNANDTSFLLDLSQTGTNPGQVRVFAGNRDPEGNITANAGDHYYRDGSLATTYVFRGSDGTNTGWRDLSAVGGVAFILDWAWDTNTAATDPGTGDVKGDNATQASITNLYISDTTDGGKDVDVILADMSSGDILILTEEDDSTRWIIFELNGAPTDNTGWWTLPGTVIQNGSAMRNGRVQAVQIFSFGGGGGGTPGGADTQVQFNDSGAFAGDAQLTWNDTTNQLTVTGDIVGLDTVTFGSAPHDEVTASGVAAIDWNDSQIQETTLTENVTSVTFTAPPGAGVFTWIIHQAAASTYTLPAQASWPSAARFVYDIAPIMPAVNDWVLVLTVVYDGTDYFITTGGPFEL